MRRLRLRLLRGVLLCLILFVPLFFVMYEVGEFLKKIYGGELPHLIRVTLAFIFGGIGILIVGYTMGKPLQELRSQIEAEKAKKPETKKRAAARWLLLSVIAVAILIGDGLIHYPNETRQFIRSIAAWFR